MMVLWVAGLVRVGVVGVGLATAAYVLAGLAIGGFGPVAAGVAVMLTWEGVVGMPTGWVLAWAGVVDMPAGWVAVMLTWAGVVGMPAGWVVGGVGGSGSATGIVGAAGLDGPVVASEGGRGCGVDVGNG